MRRHPRDQESPLGAKASMAGGTLEKSHSTGALYQLLLLLTLGHEILAFWVEIGHELADKGESVFSGWSRAVGPTGNFTKIRRRLRELHTCLIQDS